MHLTFWLKTLWKWQSSAPGKKNEASWPSKPEAMTPKNSRMTSCFSPSHCDIWVADFLANLIETFLYAERKICSDTTGASFHTERNLFLTPEVKLCTKTSVWWWGSWCFWSGRRISPFASTYLLFGSCLHFPMMISQNDKWSAREKSSHPRMLRESPLG